MPREFEDENTDVKPATGGDAGVSERSEREIEAVDKDALDDDDGDDKEVRAADDTGDADPAKAVVGLRRRLPKLTAQRNKARDEARTAASERDAYAAKVAEYERKEREAERMLEEAHRRTPAGQKAEERRAAVRQTIDETYGPGTSELLEEQRQEHERRNEEYGQRGISFLKSELDDHGVTYDQDTLIRYERAVGSELQEDPALLAAFKRPATQGDAIKEAFKRVRDGIINPVLKSGGAKALARVERNREALLGGGQNRGSVAETPEPTFDLTPPKGLTGRALQDWWADARDKYRERLLAADRSA
jgi:hypothetical protein